MTPEEPKQKSTIPASDLSDSRLQAGSEQAPVPGTALRGPRAGKKCQIAKPLATHFLFPFQSYGILLMD